MNVNEQYDDLRLAAVIGEDLQADLPHYWLCLCRTRDLPTSTSCLLLWLGLNLVIGLDLHSLVFQLE